MTVTVRLGREYLAQLAGIGVLAMDRVVLTAILLRAWGVEGFASWSVAMAGAGMVAFFDFGLNLYFSNRLTFSIERGKMRRAHHAYRAGNLLVAAAALVSTIAVCAAFWLFGKAFFGTEIDAALLATVAALTLATATRYALAVHYYLYRAHRQFERQTYLIAITDLARVLAAAIAVLLGASLLEAALAYLAAALLSSFPLALLDGRRRFPDFRYGMEMPNRAERRIIPKVAFGFWAQSVPVTIMTFLPVFILAAIGAGATAIARFVLVRTLANLARMGPQLIGTVLGQEAGRRFGGRDRAGVFLVYREGCKFLAAQSAGAAGAIVALAEPIFHLWTDNPELYSEPLLWLAIAPLALAPSITLANAVFGHANHPRAMAIGRAIQLALTAIAYVTLPMADPALRMMAALAIGEILGFGVPSYIGIRGLIPEAGPAFMLDLAARIIVSGGLCFAVSALALALLPSSLPGIAIACLIGGLSVLLMTLFIGLEPGRRAVLLSYARRSD